VISFLSLPAFSQINTKFLRIIKFDPCSFLSLIYKQFKNVIIEYIIVVLPSNERQRFRQL
jgi:hypothetical protein